MHPDATGKNALFVNDQPIEAFQKERGSGPVYEDIYEPYYIVKSLEPRFHLVIKREEASVYESTLEPGKYVVNVSSNDDIWFAQVAYGRQLGDDAQFLDRGKLGVYRLGKQPLGGVVFKFDQEPPESIRTKRGSTNTEYFILGTYTDKGIALRKGLAGLSQNKAKAEAANLPPRELTEAERTKFMDALNEDMAKSKTK